MSSSALTDLLVGAAEVRAMRTHYPVPHRGLPTGTGAIAAKAHGRACVVLLSSHLERYIYASNEEAIDWLNSQTCDLSAFPERFRLQHTRSAVDDLASRGWANRANGLRDFVATHAATWMPGGKTGGLKAGELLTWMKAPNPESLIRFYGLYGVEDIFASVTRSRGTKGALHLGIRELVEKRNNIAHGDFQTQALPMDVTRYLTAVTKFSTSADKVLGRAVGKLAGSGPRPW